MKISCSCLSFCGFIYMKMSLIANRSALGLESSSMRLASLDSSMEPKQYTSSLLEPVLRNHRTKMDQQQTAPQPYWRVLDLFPLLLQTYCRKQKHWLLFLIKENIQRRCWQSRLAITKVRSRGISGVYTMHLNSEPLQPVNIQLKMKPLF